MIRKYDKGMLGRFQKLLEKKRRELVSASDVGADYAKRQAPSRTGKLRSSIKPIHRGDKYGFESDVVYAKYQEFGYRARNGRRIRGKHFMRQGESRAIRYLKQLGYK